MAIMVTSLVLVAGSAAAQPAAEQGPPSEQAAPTDAPPAPVLDRRDDPAWQLYHRAFTALLRGQRRTAADLAATLQRDHAGHPAAQLVVTAGLGVGPSVVDSANARREEPSSSARAELALFQTVHGIVVGVELCALAECNEGSAILGLALLGGGAGAIASLVAVDELTSGQRALLNSGTAWGAVNAGLILIATEPDEAKTYPGVFLLGQLGGLVAGAGLFAVRPTAGQVALANSGGQWAGGLTFLTALAINEAMSEKAVALTVLIAADAGLIAGAVLGDRYPRVSRAQTLVIDAGGIVGLVGGAGVGVLVSGSADQRATPGLAAIGGALGLGAAAYLTRNWSDRDDDSSTLRTHLLPVEHGRGGIAGLSFNW